MSGIIKYIIEFFLKLPDKFIKLVYKKIDNLFFYITFFYRDIKYKIFNIESFEDLILKLLYKKRYRVLNKIYEDATTLKLKLYPTELKLFLNKLKLKKKFSILTTNLGLNMFYNAQLYGFNGVVATFDRRFYKILDGFFLYFNYIYINKFFFSKIYKNSNVNLRLIQTKNNFRYDFVNKGYKDYLNLFNFGLKSI